MVRLFLNVWFCVENKSRDSNSGTVFFFFAGSNANNLQVPVNSMGNVQESASTTGEGRIPRPSHLAEVLQSTRQLLTGEVADCLSVCPFPFVFCLMKSYLNTIFFIYLVTYSVFAIFF